MAQADGRVDAGVRPPAPLAPHRCPCLALVRVSQRNRVAPKLTALPVASPSLLSLSSVPRAIPRPPARPRPSRGLTPLSLPAGWTIPIAVLVVISFPPLFGHEIVAVLVGIIWVRPSPRPSRPIPSLPLTPPSPPRKTQHQGLWIGFGIVAAGTFLGEMANFFTFKYWFRAHAERLEEKDVAYACLAQAVRDGGFWVRPAGLDPSLALRLLLLSEPPTRAAARTRRPPERDPGPLHDGRLLDVRHELARLCARRHPVAAQAAHHGSVSPVPHAFPLAAVSRADALFAGPRKVYLGVALEATDASARDKAIQTSVLVITTLVTIGAAWWIWAKMKAARPAVVRGRRRRAKELRRRVGEGEGEEEERERLKGVGAAQGDGGARASVDSLGVPRQAERVRTDLSPFPRSRSALTLPRTLVRSLKTPQTPRPSTDSYAFAERRPQHPAGPNARAHAPPAPAAGYYSDPYRVQPTRSPRPPAPPAPRATDDDVGPSHHPQTHGHALEPSAASSASFHSAHTTAPLAPPLPPFLPPTTLESSNSAVAPSYRSTARSFEEALTVDDGRAKGDAGRR